MFGYFKNVAQVRKKKKKKACCENSNLKRSYKPCVFLTEFPHIIKSLNAPFALTGFVLFEMKKMNYAGGQEMDAEVGITFHSMRTFIWCCNISTKHTHTHK